MNRELKKSLAIAFLTFIVATTTLIVIDAPMWTLFLIPGYAILRLTY